MKSYGLFLNIITTDQTEIENRIAFLRSMANLGHIEVWLEHGDWTEDDSMWLKEKLNKYEVLIHAPFINFSFVATHKQINDASLEALKRACDHVEILGGKIMTLHVGRKPLYMSDDEARKNAIPYLEKLANYVDGKFELSVENLLANTGTSLRYPVKLDEVTHIVEEIPKLKVTVDIGHCFQNNDAYELFFKHNAGIISNIHVHNALRNGKAHFGFGKSGDIGLQEFLSFLDKVGYNNYFTFEILDDTDIKDSWCRLQKLIK